jgi:hypothetical protein
MLHTRPPGTLGQIGVLNSIPIRWVALWAQSSRTWLIFSRWVSHTAQLIFTDQCCRLP